MMSVPTPAESAALASPAAGVASRHLSTLVHRWVGLAAALFLFIESITGGIMAWGPEVARWFNRAAPPPEPRYELKAPNRQPSLAAAIERLKATHHGALPEIIRFSEPGRAWSAEFEVTSSTFAHVWFDPSDGSIIAERMQEVRLVWLQNLVRFAGRFHGNVFAAAALVALVTSGLVLWWRQKSFRLDGPRSLARANRDGHKIVGFYASAFLLLFAITGMVMAAQRPTLALLNALLRTPSSAEDGSPSTPPSTTNAPVSVDRGFELARQAAPNANFTLLQWVAGRGKRIVFSGRDGLANVHVFVELSNGRVQVQREAREPSLAEKIVRRWTRQIHTGEIYGPPTRWLAGAASFGLAFLAVTGPAIYWIRRRPRQDPRGAKE